MKADAASMQELLPESQMAYDAELRGDWTAAHGLHAAADALWVEFAGSASLLSTESRIVGRAAELRAKLHRERVGYIGAFLKGSGPVPDVVSLHASMSVLMKGLNPEATRMASLQSPMEEIKARMPLNMVRLAHVGPPNWPPARGGAKNP
jgi:hypothetical protein